MNYSMKKIEHLIIIVLLVAAFTIIESAAGGKIPEHGDVHIFSPALSVSSPIFVVYVENITRSNGIGTYTIKTGALHPYPDENVFFGGRNGAPWSSYNTIRVNGSSKEYIQTTGSPANSPGYIVDKLDNYVTQYPAIAGNSIITCWTTPERLNITQIIEVVGTKLDDSSVRITTQIRNDNNSTQRIGLRYEWDIMVDDKDDSWFSQKDPEGTFSNVFRAFIPPAFGYYEIVNNLTSPMISVFGSVSEPLFLTPPPTPPDSLIYIHWDNSYYLAFDYTPDDCGKDCAILYYWDPITIQPGNSTNLTAYVTTQEKAITDPPWDARPVPSMTPVGIAAFAVILGALAVMTIRIKL